MFYKVKVDYFCGDGLNLTADEVMGAADHCYRTGDTIEVAEYDKEQGDVTDVYQITDIQKDEDGLIAATVMFIEERF